jgi:hypothetical protein
MWIPDSDTASDTGKKAITMPIKDSVTRTSGLDFILTLLRPKIFLRDALPCPVS